MYNFNFNDPTPLLPAQTQTTAKESRRVQNNLKRASERGMEASLTLDQWLAILDANQWCCVYCGADMQSMEHVLPIGEGGGTTATNCVPACHSCNHARNHVHNVVRNAVNAILEKTKMPAFVGDIVAHEFGRVGVMI